MLAPLWHLICIHFLFAIWDDIVGAIWNDICGAIRDDIWCKFSIIIKQINTSAAPCKGAIWDEISEQQLYQNIKKTLYPMPN